jgi:hypothetical protein
MAEQNIEFACKIETLSEETGSYLPTGHIIMGYGLGGNEGKHGIYFKPSKHASDTSLRNFFGVNQTGRKTIELSKALPSVSDILPTYGSFIHEKLSHLINGFGSRNDSERLKALVKHEGTIEKYGMRVTDVSPGVKNMRDQSLSRGIENARSEVIESEKEILEAISLYPGIFTNEDVVEGGPLEKNKEYTSFIVKSCGSSHLVFDDPSDPSKLIKAIRQPDEKIKNSLINFEVLANNVVRGADMKAPLTEIAVLNENGTRAIKMDNFAVRNGVQECRRQSFMSFLGKHPDEIHQMSYDEMARGLDLYEKQLPKELQNASAHKQNKIAIAQWAMVNSAVNNTDNHGRNLEVMKDTQGRIEVSPFYDVTFDNNERPMSTAVGGIPPIHKIDIMNDSEIANLCDHLGLADSVDEVLGSRDKLLESMTKIPEYAEKLGMDVFSPDMDHIISSVAKQSPGLKAAVEIAIEAARNSKVADLAASKGKDSSMGMGM